MEKVSIDAARVVSALMFGIDTVSHFHLDIYFAFIFKRLHLF